MGGWGGEMVLLFVLSLKVILSHSGFGLFSQKKLGVLCAAAFPHRVYVGIRLASTARGVLA